MKLPQTQANDDDKPKTLIEKIYNATPVVLTVVATVLAGLSSSEMTRAQYFRTLAAQAQSKASDQWAYYQAKRERAVNAQNTLDLLSAHAQPASVRPERLLGASFALIQSCSALPTKDAPSQPWLGAEDAVASARRLDDRLKKLLTDSGVAILASAPIDAKLPKVSEQPIKDEQVRQAMQQATEGQTEAQMAPLLEHLQPSALTDALHTADDNLKAFDAAITPTASALDDLRAIIAGEALLAQDTRRLQPDTRHDNATPDAGAALQAIQTDVDAERLRFAQARYEAEAKYNGVSAQIYEVQVRQNGVISDRHRVRSTDFFYGMLAAQAGVTVASLGLAVRRKSLFWSLATFAGATAVVFSAYVYFGT